MRLPQRILGAALSLLLAAALVLWWRTSPQDAGAKPPTAAGTDANARQVDRSVYDTALHLKPLAATATEQALADDAMRLADHDLDLAFTAALRRMDAHPPKLSEAALRIAERLERSQQQFAHRQQRIAELTAELTQAPPARLAALADELGLVQSQLELDQYEMEEANQDLDNAGGNQRQRIVAESQEREQQEVQRAAHPPVAAAPAPAVRGGLIGEFLQWRALGKVRRQILDAGNQAAALGASLAHDRQALATAVGTQKSAVADQAQRGQDSALSLELSTASIAADQNVLTLLEQRVRAQRTLGEVYRRWSNEVAARLRTAEHALAAGAAGIIVLLLVLLYLDRWLQRAFMHRHIDRRRMETLHSVSRTILQLLAVSVLLLMLLGIPNQFGTVLGVIGAGLTVALKDFIVAFVGWVVLMGRNGMRIGDWVEINGVSGEVIELGMFRTVLLETGSWGDSGHPTGRRVTFANSFAISGHYFNFSTSGQWLWDELLLVVPMGRDPQPIIEALRAQVTTATADSARQAEQEWQRAVPSPSGRVFSGTPGISARPVVGGVEISIRYITRADDRFQLRGKLYQAAVTLLGEAPQR